MLRIRTWLPSQSLPFSCRLRVRTTGPPDRTGGRDTLLPVCPVPRRGGGAAGRATPLEPHVFVSSLTLSDFRNYAHLSIELPPEGALFQGPNGSGKTNLLEAVHLLCVGRSQRSGPRAQMIRHSAPAASVRATFQAGIDTGRTDAHIGFDRAGTVRMTRDGRVVATRREWFGGATVVALGPEDLRLVDGGPGERRRFLDMLLSQVDGDYLSALLQYNRALANRNRVLADQGADRLCDVYEETMVRHGRYLYERRARIVDLCQDWFARYYAEISDAAEAASLQFRPSISPSDTGFSEWENVFYKALKNNRKQDRELGYSRRGPHRDDLLISLDKRPARTYASQGQLRSLALALRLCAVRCIEQFRAETMVVLVDDAFSELDDRRIARVYPLIRQRGQVLMATPVDRIPLQIDLRRFAVSNGAVKVL
ncbi:MAG: DNA replication and repair protein RecF [Chitinivibrionales bacterium]|nr:DNA replication and repair protein RecF [Chitinivibrionales bacterium]